MSNESSDSKIIWNIVDDIDKVTTDETVLNGKSYIKIAVTNKGTKILGAEPKKREAAIISDFKKHDGCTTFMDFIRQAPDKKSSDGNVYYAIVVS